MTSIRIKLRTPSGTQVLALQETTTVRAFRERISKESGLSSYLLKRGFPPAVLDLSSLDQDSALSSIKPALNGEQLMVSRDNNDSSPAQQAKASAPTPAPPSRPAQAARSSASSQTPKPQPSQPKPSPKRQTDTAPSMYLPAHSATLLVRVMPDDNSCLFSAINHAALGSTSSKEELRAIIASAIQQNPDDYSDAVLGQPRDDYCRWIQMPDSWGGGIELSIFSKHFNLEIASIDVETLRVDRFNEGAPMRCILVYSGIHYDAIALSPGDADTPLDFDNTQFSPFQDDVLQAALMLCKKLQAKGYFTNTNTFSLVCKQCGSQFTGQQQAIGHAKATGHTQLDQITA